jgi:hypothetical protein
MTDKTTAADQRGPLAPCQSVPLFITAVRIGLARSSISLLSQPELQSWHTTRALDEPLCPCCFLRLIVGL